MPKGMVGRSNYKFCCGHLQAACAHYFAMHKFKRVAQYDFAPEMDHI